MIVSWLTPGRNRRRLVRGNINVFFYYIAIARFIKKTYNEKTKTIRFVRQVSTNRMTCVVNNRYYVKVFRDVSVSQLNDYKFLLDFIRPYLDINIPEIFVAKHIPMYTADKLPGKDLRYLNKDTVIKHEAKIKSQILKMINDMQNIPLRLIPNKERFLSGLQSDHKNKQTQITKNSVLAHLDLNASNFLLDDKFNVISVLDWDSVQIVPDANIDLDNFLNLWSIYKNSKTAKP